MTSRLVAILFSLTTASFAVDADPLYAIDLTVARQGFDNKMCWVHARAGAIPGTAGTQPTVVMTMQKLDISGSDVYYALNEIRTTDGGATWTEPKEHASFARVPFSWQGKPCLETTVCYFSPRWHASTQKLLGTGHTVVYENNRGLRVRPRGTAYAVYDAGKQSWSPWKTVKMPADPKFDNSGAGCVQRVDLENGDILLPTYFKPIGTDQYSTTVMRCQFDGETLLYVEHGSELRVPVKRGLYEPSLTRFGERFFLTMRNDDDGYVSVSDDGLTFNQPNKWTYDDGEILGNYNTQQHWVSNSDALFLVYTRRGANNDHVFRHRAPLFMARVDPDKLQIIRASEQILVPEKGARMGNFGVTEISSKETWVTVTEWMQGPAPNYSDPAPILARGADNRIWVAKIKWNQPNGNFR